MKSIENTSENIHISIVSPIYKGEVMLQELVDRITATVRTITPNYEILLIEDRSPDNSWAKIREICAADKHVKAVRFSKNFGQFYALTAGLDLAKGEWIVVLDCDLQDQPEEIVKLYNKAREGYDIVFAARVERNDTVFKRMGSFMFYRFLAYMTGVQQDETIANFGIYHRRVAEATFGIREKTRYFPSMMRWVGFTTASVPIAHANRAHGKSSYSLSMLIKLATNIMLAYSDKPLKFTIKLGVFISGMSFLFGIIVLLKYLMGGILVSGYTSLILAICFFSGIIIMTMGVLALYIGKIYDEVKNRPLYLIDKHINFGNDNP